MFLRHPSPSGPWRSGAPPLALVFGGLKPAFPPRRRVAAGARKRLGDLRAPSSPPPSRPSPSLLSQLPRAPSAQILPEMSPCLPASPPRGRLLGGGVAVSASAVGVGGAGSPSRRGSWRPEGPVQRAGVSRARPDLAVAGAGVAPKHGDSWESELEVFRIRCPNRAVEMRIVQSRKVVAVLFYNVLSAVIQEAGKQPWGLK